MNTSEEIKKELRSLLDEQNKLYDLLKDPNDTIEFGSAYQRWYSRAYKVVESLAPERLEEFVSYYRVDPKRKSLNAGNFVIQDYVKAIAAPTDHLKRPLWDTNNLTTIRLMNQLQILASLSSRIESVIQDVKGHLFADLQDAELNAAAELKRVSNRAAGALAGVVLERHLQRTVENHEIKIRKKSPTVADLNDPLKQAGVYDVPTWRKIQLLGDLRNLCTHQKKIDPTSEQIDELIAGVNAIVKTVF